MYKTNTYGYNTETKTVKSVNGGAENVFKLVTKKQNKTKEKKQNKTKHTHTQQNTRKQTNKHI